jgi:hypothetical protein
LTAAVTGAAISVTGGRSKDTPRYRRGITPLRERARARLTRWARQRQSRAVFVASSKRKPLPSQRPNAQASSWLGSGAEEVLIGPASVGHTSAGSARLIR